MSATYATFSNNHYVVTFIRAVTVPSLERRQLLDAVGGALSCQLEDEAGRLRQLHRQQLQQLWDELQQLERQRQLETEQLQNQVSRPPAGWAECAVMSHETSRGRACAQCIWY